MSDERTLSALQAAVKALPNSPERAAQVFRIVTTDDPTGADGWLGRVATGDTSLQTLQTLAAHAAYLGRDLRALHLTPADLRATFATDYVSLRIIDAGTAKLSYIAALIDTCRFQEASDLLGEVAPSVQVSYVRAVLHRRTDRWADVLNAVAGCAGWIDVDMVRAGSMLETIAAANLGLLDRALEAASRAAIGNVDDQMTRDALFYRALVLRHNGDTDVAHTQLTEIRVRWPDFEAAQTALADPTYALTFTDEATIDTRTDKWDPATETSRGARAAADLADERRDVLADAQARIDELIGLVNIKEQVSVWRTDKQIEQIERLLDEEGDEARSSDGDHMIFEGPPGTAKTTVARIIAEVLFGLGKLERPEVTEVSEADIVVGYISQTATRMREKCEEALGGVLFIDEAYTLVPQTEGHSFGKEAIDTLLKFMEDHRDQFVVIAAGYAQPMRRFLRANEGFASRFNFTLTFSSYAPDEIVQIAQLIARKDRLTVEPAAWDVLHGEASQLLSVPDRDGTLLDAAGNGRYARKVVGACKGERARRLHRAAPQPQDLEQLVRADRSALNVNVDDMQRALAKARPTT